MCLTIDHPGRRGVNVVDEDKTFCGSGLFEGMPIQTRVRVEGMSRAGMTTLGNPSGASGAVGGGVVAGATGVEVGPTSVFFHFAQLNCLCMVLCCVGLVFVDSFCRFSWSLVDNIIFSFFLSESAYYSQTNSNQENSYNIVNVIKCRCEESK